MPRLTPCRSCHSHVFADERECPHCGASLRSNAALPAVLVGLALAGCPGEPEYGVPDTGTPEETAGKTTDTDGGTGTETDTGMETTTAGEPEYGVSET